MWQDKSFMYGKKYRIFPDDEFTFLTYFADKIYVALKKYVIKS